MHAMQYEITLPADYDMAIVRRRIATRGQITDAFAGLGLKAYLIRERDVDGSRLNQYAPFYLWRTAEGMNRFLWGGGGFSGIIESFGRPSALTWSGIACLLGSAHATVPASATRERLLIPAEVDLQAAVHNAVENLGRVARLPGVHSTALAVDPTRWELVHFTLWAGQVDEKLAGERYQVLHLSMPEFDEIAHKELA